jgi:hypothetical protein
MQNNSQLGELTGGVAAGLIPMPKLDPFVVYNP